MKINRMPISRGRCVHPVRCDHKFQFLRSSRCSPNCSIKKLLTVLLLACPLAGLTSRAQPAGADVLFTNGTIHLNSTTTTTSLAIRDGHVLAVGADALAGGASRSINLHGGAVWPGFTDSHSHYLGGSFISMGVRLNTAEPLADMAAIKAAVTSWIGGPTDAGAPTWIFGFGWNTAVVTAPDGHALDDIPRPVVLIDGGGHSCIANSMAMSLGGITDETVVPGGEIVRDAEGHATGWLKENGVGPVLSVALQQTPDALFGAAVPTVAGALASQGVTGISEIMGMPGLPISGRENVYRALERGGNLPIRVHFYVPAYSVAEALSVWSRYATAAPTEDTPMVRFAGGKIWVDGGCDSGAADTSFPHVHSPTRYFSLSELRQLVELAEDIGIPVQFHTNGDRAVDDVLTALEEAKTAKGTLQPHILVHLPFTTPERIQRIKVLGVTVSGQPIFWEQTGYATELAEYGEFARSIYDYAAMFAAGVTLGCGTDWPAVDTPMEDFSPMKGLAVATSSFMRLAGDSRRITASQFLAGYTAGSAATVNRRDLGHLEPGAAADLVVFDKDPLTNPGIGALYLKIKQTWVGGNLVSGSVDAFDTWAASKGLVGADAELDADPDHDGVPNGIEFVIGGDPNPASPKCNTSDRLPQANIDGGRLVVAYTLMHEAASMKPVVQISSDLQGWTDVVDGKDEAVITVISGVDSDTVRVSIPSVGASPKFMRLKVAQ